MLHSGADPIRHVRVTANDAGLASPLSTRATTRSSPGADAPLAGRVGSGENGGFTTDRTILHASRSVDGGLPLLPVWRVALDAAFVAPDRSRARVEFLGPPVGPCLQVAAVGQGLGDDATGRRGNAVLQRRAVGTVILDELAIDPDLVDAAWIGRGLRPPVRTRHALHAALVALLFRAVGVVDGRQSGRVRVIGGRAVFLTRERAPERLVSIPVVHLHDAAPATVDVAALHDLPRTVDADERRRQCLAI